MDVAHPLDPLQPAEISLSSQIVRDAFPGAHLNFRVITLKEPPKNTMISFLDSQYDGNLSNNYPPRVAMVHVLVSNENTRTQFFELLVDLNTSVVLHKEYLAGRHSYIDAEYMKAAEKACLADPKVQQQIADLKLPTKATVVVEPWAYATDGMNEMKERITMCWFYLRLSDNPDSNYYAYPLDVCAEVSETLKVTTIYRLPSGEHGRIGQTANLFDHSRIHQNSEYHPEFVEPRDTTRPYQVLQPDGPSFKIDGQHITWEKWTFRVGFNYREGLTLHDIRFDSRSLFYRLSLAEMFVPYGDSRSPYQRKGAFDLGNDGAGLNANNLRLGCDCLGHIKYFDGWHNTASGEPLRLPNAVCCHEVDDGILWKHTNFRTNNPAVARSRVLILQTVVTVTNYEYIFAFHFKQDASIHFEVRATGILSTTPIDIGDSVSFGTLVAPGVMAPYHQHLFSLRIDPSLDGHNNTFNVEETVPMPFIDPPDPNSTTNPFGVGFTKTTQIVTHEDHFDLDHARNRTFKIVNENHINPITGTPVGYQLIPHYSQTLLAHPSSFHARRSEFAAHAVWLTRHHDEEMYPAGTFTMQSAGGEGIASWINNRKEESASRKPKMTPISSTSATTINGTETNGTKMNGTSANHDSTTEHANHGNDNDDPTSTRNTDIVVWHTFGSTHIPRIEDWPVMPCEKMGVTLKPVNFFAGNPGLDVAGPRLEGSRSVLV